MLNNIDCVPSNVQSSHQEVLLNVFRVETRRLRGRRGFTRQLENSKRAHLRVLAFKNTTKIQRKDQQEREKRMKTVAGEGKKSEILGVQRRRGPAEGGSSGGRCPAEGLDFRVQGKGFGEQKQKQNKKKMKSMMRKKKKKKRKRERKKRKRERKRRKQEKADQEATEQTPSVPLRPISTSANSISASWPKSNWPKLSILGPSPLRRHSRCCLELLCHTGLCCLTRSVRSSFLREPPGSFHSGFCRVRSRQSSAVTVGHCDLQIFIHNAVLASQ